MADFDDRFSTEPGQAGAFVLGPFVLGRSKLPLKAGKFLFR